MIDVALRVADVGDLLVLRELVQSYHAFEGISCPGGDTDGAVSPLLGENELGRIWLIGVGEETVGYVAICFGYSIEFGGRDAFIDEMYISEQYRGQGIGTEVMRRIGAEAQALGVKALHLEVSRNNKKAQRLYEKSGFTGRDQFYLMSARQG